LLGVLASSVEWHMIGFFLDQKPDRKGVDEIWDYVSFLHSEFEDIHAAPEEFVAMGERIIVPVHVTGRGVHSGVPGELRFTSVFTLAGSRIAEVRNYMNKAEALEALGHEQ
jgi:ketosteroid isomerase-like protein